jgi:hypothetical protein
MLAGSHGLEFDKEHAELEAYATANGYTIRQGGHGEYYVYSGQDLNTSLAACSMRSEAVRIAYAMAKVFPPGEAA